MVVNETIDIDLDRVDTLIEEEEAKLEPKHRASIAYREVAERTIAGGVASSWQASPPHAIYIDHGQGNRLWDIDGNEYVDFHLGYGAMVAGHAHPEDRRGDRGQARSARTSRSRRSTSTRSGTTSWSGSGCRSGGSATRGPRQRSRPRVSCARTPAAT